MAIDQEKLKFHIRGIEHRDHRAILVLLERKERSLHIALREVADVGELPGLDLAIDMSVVLEILTAAQILTLEIDTGTLRHRYNPQTQHQRQARNGRRSKEIGPHQSAETHTTRQHSDNLGLVGHLRGKEDYRDEGKQTTKLIDEVGDEVYVVVKDDGRPRGVRLGEVIHTLGIVEDHQDDGNHRNGEEVGSQKLPQYVTIENLKSRPR
jgi:hypothetical protein